MHISGLTIAPELFPAEDLYPFNVDALRGTRELLFETPATFFVGENGTGKSTLLEALARRCNIHIWRGFERSRVKRSPYESRLYEYIQVHWTADLVPGAFFASEIFRNFSQLVDEWASTDPGLLSYFGDRSLMQQSHGQSHMAYFESRFMLEGLYLLDEPENALSPSSQLALLDILTASTAAGKGQFVMATHSPILLSLPGARILSFDGETIDRVAYEDTEHYRVYRDFFDTKNRR